MTEADSSRLPGRLIDARNWCGAIKAVHPGLRQIGKRLDALSKRIGCALLLAALGASPVVAQSNEELVSFRCALAIDAVLAELDAKADNLVIQQVLNQIDDINGQLVCISISADEIQVRMQSTDMHPNDNRLVFSLDAKTYTVKKTFYGR